MDSELNITPEIEYNEGSRLNVWATLTFGTDAAFQQTDFFDFTNSGNAIFEHNNKKGVWGFYGRRLCLLCV